MDAIRQEFLDQLNASEKNVASKRPIENKRTYQAKVVATEEEHPDGQKWGRVKVWIPDLMYGTTPENDGIWAMPGMSLFAGNAKTTLPGMKDCGSLCPPPKETYVLVYFEDDDYSYPRYVGGLIKEQDESVPVENQYGDNWSQKWTLLKTPKGRQILLSDDESNDECIIIRGKYKNRTPAREYQGDPRLPSDSQAIQFWEMNGEKYMLVQCADGKYIKMDETEDTIRIQHQNGSYIEFTKEGDILIEPKRYLITTSKGPKYKKPYTATPKKPKGSKSRPGCG